MPRIVSNRLVAVCALALTLSFSLALATAASGFSAKLRVVGSSGRVLAEKPVATGDVKVKSSPRADCFGSGTGGSGKAISLAGDTAMGLLARAAKTTSSLRPLLLSDHFDFGTALCGVGGSVAGGESSWYLKINHKAQLVGGDQAKIRPGDNVLWALAKTSAPDFKYPNELWLVAPRRARAGTGFGVRVFSFDEQGRRTPAAGVKVTGAGTATGADGRTTVTLSRPRALIATKSGEIPSQRIAVCVGGKCPGGSR